MRNREVSLRQTEHEAAGEIALFFVLSIRMKLSYQAGGKIYVLCAIRLDEKQLMEEKYMFFVLSIRIKLSHLAE